MRFQVGLFLGAALFVVTVAVHPAAQGGPPPAGGAQGGRGGGAPAAPAPPGGARATFPAQQRPPGDPALIARGNGIYGVNCRACHGVDLRGGDQGGPNLLRSQLVLNDQTGELIGPVVQMGRTGGVGVMPPFPNLGADDVRALAEYIHSVTASMRGQGNPPLGPPAVLNVLVGNAAAGQAYFNARCASCHSATGDMRGIGSRLSDPTALQNFWLSAGGGIGGRGGRGGGVTLPESRQTRASVTLANGQKVEGFLVRLDDFYVVVRLADGSERSFRRDGERPVVELTDPLAGHKNLLPIYADSDIHNVTAYLVTLK